MWDTVDWLLAMIIPIMIIHHFHWGDLHHLQRQSYMIGREDKRKNNRTMLQALQNNAAAGYQGPVKNRAFKRCMSTVFIGQNPNFGLI